MKNKTKHILTGIFALSLFGTASAQITVEAAWDFNEGSGTTTTSLASSYSWNGNTQTTTSLTQYTSDAFSSAQWSTDAGIAPGSSASLSFDGTLAQAFSSNFDGTGITGAGSKTFVAWIAPDADDGFFMNYSPNSDPGASLRAGLSASAGLRAEVTGGGFDQNNFFDSGNVNKPDYGTWGMVAVVFNSSGGVIYEAGFEGNTVTSFATGNWNPGTTLNTASGAELLFGTDQTEDRNFDGLLGAAAVYSGAATQMELQNIYDTGVVIPEPGTLVLVGVALGALMIFRRRR